MRATLRILTCLSTSPVFPAFLLVQDKTDISFAVIYMAQIMSDKFDQNQFLEKNFKRKESAPKTCFRCKSRGKQRFRASFRKRRPTCSPTGQIPPKRKRPSSARPEFPSATRQLVKHLCQGTKLEFTIGIFPLLRVFQFFC